MCPHGFTPPPPLAPPYASAECYDFLSWNSETAAAVKFARSMSAGSDHEPSKLERQLSRRASLRLSKHRPGSALSRQDSHVRIAWCHSFFPQDCVSISSFICAFIWFIFTSNNVMEYSSCTAKVVFACNNNYFAWPRKFVLLKILKFMYTSRCPHKERP